MSDIPVNGNTYRIGKLNTFQQWHIARRLLPVLSALGGMMLTTAGAESAEQGAAAPANILGMITPLADVLGKMTDAESEYVLNTCLSVVTRQEGAGYAPVKVPGAHTLQYADIDLSTMLSLVLAVIREHRLLDFTHVFPSAPA